MASVTRKTLRRQLGGVLKVRGKKALAAAFLPASGNTTTTVSVPTLGAFPAETNYFTGARLSVVAGTNTGTTRGITNFVQSTGTLTHGAFASSQDTTSDCEVWRHGLDADTVNDAITLAVQEVDTAALVFTQDTTFATELGRYEYPIPSTLEWLYKVQVCNASPLFGHDASNAVTARALMDDAARTRLAQQIVIDDTTVIWGYLLHLAKEGTPTGTLTAELQTNSAGLPSGTAVAGSAATLAASALTTVGSYRFFQLARPLPVTAATYHLVLRTSASADASNYVRWSEDNDSPTYDDGTLEVYNGSAWSEVSGSVQVFQVLGDPSGAWVDWPASGWHITRDATTQLALVHKPTMDVGLGFEPSVYEGRPIRLFGYRDADAPTSDSATVEANPNYVLAVAITYLLQGMEQDEVAADLQYWQRKTELMRSQQPVRTRLMPNTVRIRDSY